MMIATYSQSIKSLPNGIQIKNGSDTVWSLTNTGFYTPDGRNVTLKQLGVTLESVTKTIYVSSYTGDDSNGGTSWGDAFATFDKAIDTIGNLLDVTVTVQIDSGTYYASKESIRAIGEMKANANVDILSKGMTDTIMTLTSVTQDNDTLFKYYTLTDLSTMDLDSAYVEGTFRLPIHSNGNDYVILATAESSGVGTVVTKNKTRLIVNDADHIVLNYLSEYSRGGITFQNLKFSPLGNKALRLAAFGTSKLKFDGCDIQALNVQNNNVIINQCHLYTAQRGIVLNNYNSFIEQSVIYGPGKTSGNSCFDIQNGNMVIDNLIIDGFGQVFENSQGIANIGFYDNLSDLYITNCEKVFSANDGFYVGSGDLNSLLIDNVDYLYNIISDKNIGIILDTSILVGNPVIGYVQNDDGIRIKPEKNYVAYIKGVHDTSTFQVPNKKYVDDKIGGANNDLLFHKNGRIVSADTLNNGFVFSFDGQRLYIEEPLAGSYIDMNLDPEYPTLEYYVNDSHYYSSNFKISSPFEQTTQVGYDSGGYSNTSGHFINTLKSRNTGSAYKWTDYTLAIDSAYNYYTGLFSVASSLPEYTTGYKSGTYLFYDETTGKDVRRNNIRLWQDGIHFTQNFNDISVIDMSGVHVKDTIFTDNIKPETDTAITMGGAVNTKTITLAETSGAITIDCNLSNVFFINVTGDITSLNVDNIAAGGFYIVGLKQSVGGGNAINLGSSFITPVSSHTAFDDTGDVTNHLQFWSYDGITVYYSNTPD